MRTDGMTMDGMTEGRMEMVGRIAGTRCARHAAPTAGAAGLPSAGVMDPAAAKRQEGYSLIEVIIAIGVLSGVLISIASMFMIGGRQVKSGKTITAATIIVQDIMENLDQRSYNSLYASLGGTSTGTGLTVLSNVSTSPIYAWNDTIRNQLAGGVATVTLTPVGPGTPTFGSAKGLRVLVSLTWQEVGRPQTVRASTVRF